MTLNKGGCGLKEMTITKSRYCKRCDAVLKFQCNCPNHKRMAWQRKNVFHSGKRYKGKNAWKKIYPDDEYQKVEEK